ncbi:ribosome recycling factor [Candidatus Berkelbacteria bacterium]|nr:ribosome recycling factor [Candidatus Berkelbacteria bacterium]
MNIKQLMEQAVVALEEDLRTLRPGRASSDLVGTLPVSAYGSSSQINALAAISANEQGQLIISPWDKSVIGAVENAIRDSQLGFSVINEGAQLRLTLPPMSQERRMEFVKLTQQKGEATRIKLRQIRTDALQDANRKKTCGEIREDELTRLTKDLNEAIDHANTKIKQAVEAKEKELLNV